MHQIFKHNESVRISRLVMLLLAAPTSVFFMFGDHRFGRNFLGLCKSLVQFQLMLISSILFYRLSPWHPLAQYPGPLLCKASKIYWLIATRNGNQHKVLAKLHKKYGDIVRTGVFLFGFYYSDLFASLKLHCLFKVQMKYPSRTHWPSTLLWVHQGSRRVNVSRL